MNFLSNEIGWHHLLWVLYLHSLSSVLKGPPLWRVFGVREQKRGDGWVKMTICATTLHNISEFRRPHHGPKCPVRVIMLAHDRNTHNYPSHLQGVGSRISMDSKTQGCPSPLYKMALCAQPSVSGVWHMWIHSTYRKRQQVQQRTLSKQDSCSFHKVLHTRELNHVFMLNFFQIFILK